MKTIVRWPADERLSFLGRNGYGKCTGLEVSFSEGLVDLRPFTSRNRPARCHIQVPPSAVPEIVALLAGICNAPMRE